MMQEEHIIFVTERCIVREIFPDDIDALFTLYDKPTMTDYIEPLYEREEEIEYRKNYVEQIYRVFGFGMWGVFYKETGELIGVCGIEYREGFTWDTADLGYAIAPEYRRMGICTEVVKQTIAFAREHTSLSYLQARIRDDNTPSIAFATSLGFSRTDQMTDDERVYLLEL